MGCERSSTEIEGIHAASYFCRKTKQPSLIPMLKTPRESNLQSFWITKEVQNWDTDALGGTCCNTLRKVDDEIKLYFVRKWSSWFLSEFKHPYNENENGRLLKRRIRTWRQRKANWFPFTKCITHVKKSGYWWHGPLAQQAAKEELAKAHFSIVWYAFELKPFCWVKS